MPGKSRAIEFTPEFKRNLRLLARKYRRIRSDVEPLLARLQTGETPGDQVPGTGYLIFKVRVKNSDLERGKSGGYRVIYYLVTEERIILVTIYSKTEQSDISVKKIRQIIEQMK
ncbi:MAG: type II toxin-antitoxin system RelE/ParE family toxin [Chloroflexota bacterium]